MADRNEEPSIRGAAAQAVLALILLASASAFTVAGLMIALRWLREGGAG